MVGIAAMKRFNTFERLLAIVMQILGGLLALTSFRGFGQKQPLLALSALILGVGLFVTGERRRTETGAPSVRELWMKWIQPTARWLAAEIARIRFQMRWPYITYDQRTETEQR
jgi:hypothetical protein